jgi:hypothetical protein
VTWTRLTSTLAPTATGYIDNTVARSTQYFYRVGAVIGADPPLFSNIAPVITK